MEDERRSFVRIKKGISVRFHYALKDGTQKWDETAVRDISETGMSVVTNKEFSHNDIIPFLIKIPSRPLDWIEVSCRVVLSQGARDSSGNPITEARITRVEFINLTQEQQGIIREYISWVIKTEKGEKK